MAWRSETDRRIIPQPRETLNEGNVNVYQPTHVRPVKGDVTPFKEFLTKLFPIEQERIAVTDFIATMIARPQQRPGFGLLLYSIKQGTGKTTLCNFMETLVGRHNVSLPDAATIVNDSYNTWVNNKVLAVCAEIYEGHSWKAYLRLKQTISDRSLTLKEKYMTNRTIPNYVWIIACSNDPQAVRVEDTDRRLLIPEVTEEAAGQAYFTKLYDWFEHGGIVPQGVV
jgi:phage/plasmid-associated DNA primase